MNIGIIGCSSGLGFEIYKLLKKNNLVFPFSSAKKKNFIRINLYKLNLKKFRNDLKKINKIDEVYYVSNYSFHKAIKFYSTNDFEKLINFNILNFCKIIKELVLKNQSITINLVLSHICFMYNRGFVFYKSHKIFQKIFLDSMQIEFPKLKINFFYPGALNTNFVKHNNYKGRRIFQPTSAKKAAYMIVNRKKKFLTLRDAIFYYIYKLLPDNIIINFYKVALKVIYNNKN